MFKAPCYILLYSIDESRIQDFQSTIHQYYHWWTFTKDAIIISTNEDCEAIYKRLSKICKDKDYFVFIELKENGFRRDNLTSIEARDWLYDKLGFGRL